jgi:hypothetical protein
VCGRIRLRHALAIIRTSKQASSDKSALPALWACGRVGVWAIGYRLSAIDVWARPVNSAGSVDNGPKGQENIAQASSLGWPKKHVKPCKGGRNPRADQSSI